MAVHIETEQLHYHCFVEVHCANGAGITVQACKHACMYTCTHIPHIQTSTYQHKFYCPMLLRVSCKNYKKSILLNQSKATHKHACCKGACMYIHPPHTYNINPPIYAQKYLNFGLWPKRPPLAFFMTETSVAEMSWPKRPWPKCPWPKYPTFVWTKP